MSVPATYHSGTPQNQHPAVARWHAHLRGLATAIHETSGLVMTLSVLRMPNGRVSFRASRLYLLYLSGVP
jgi:hypothetical protein